MLSKTQNILRLNRKCHSNTEELTSAAGLAAGASVVGGGEASKTTPVDDSLTSLNWLHNLNIMGDMSAPTPPTPPASPGPSGIGTGDFLPPAAICVTTPMAGSGAVGVTGGNSGGGGGGSSGRRGAARSAAPSPPADVDYKSNGDVKPPFSYATLICMAMKANRNKMSLSAIYKWIRDNFMYYRRADTGWQNSIRHNLSLNKCFIKVARNKDEPGKGGFWRLDPAYAEEMADGTFKKRRLASRPSNAPKKSRPPRKELHLPPPQPQQQQQQQPTDTTLQQQQHSVTTPAPQHHHHQQLQQPTSNTPYYMMPPSAPLAADSIGMCGAQQHQSSLSEEDEAGLAVAALKGDFCWTSVLNEDIEVEGLHYRTSDIVDLYRGSVGVHHQAQSQHQHLQQSCTPASAYLGSPALSLDDDDLMGAPSSDPACVTEGAPLLGPDWWRLTAMADPLTSFGPGDVYDVATATFLGPGWDEGPRPVLDAAQLNLDELMDLDVDVY